MISKDKRAERISISLPAGMVRQLQTDARLEGVTLSAYIRSLILEHDALQQEINQWIAASAAEKEANDGKDN